jgi:hypothetical protein
VPRPPGGEVVNAVGDRVRAEMLRRIGLGELLTPRRATAEGGRASAVPTVPDEGRSSDHVAG